MIATFVWGLFAVSPLLCAMLLTRSWISGLALPFPGRFGVPLCLAGCLAWYPPILKFCAISGGSRWLILMPGVIGPALCVAWEYRRLGGRDASVAWGWPALFAAFGFMIYVACGGGYYDAVIQVPHARSLARGKSAQELAGMLDSSDRFARGGASIELQERGKDAEPAAAALAAVVLSNDEERIRRSARYALKSIGRQAALAALVTEDKGADPRSGALADALHEISVSQEEWKAAIATRR